MGFVGKNLMNESVRFVGRDVRIRKIRGSGDCESVDSVDCWIVAEVVMLWIWR